MISDLQACNAFLSAVVITFLIFIGVGISVGIEEDKKLRKIIPPPPEDPLELEFQALEAELNSKKEQQRQIDTLRASYENTRGKWPDYSRCYDLWDEPR